LNAPEDQGVSLVIPGRNVAGTIRQCLEAVVPLLERGALAEVIFVDDGSTDDSREVVAAFPVRCLAGPARGAGAARNLGWRSARSPLIWFVDADCVVEPDALERLLPHMQDPRVGGVSGSYGNMRPESLLACLIHEEIIDRHLRMGDRVNFAATFNVLYRRGVLEQIGGFDERFLKGQDAELSWRVLAAGYEIGFEQESRVRHYHEDRWLPYFRTQRRQGYWRVFLHLTHRGHARGDSYSSFVDHVQPPLAMLSLAALPLLAFPVTRWLPLVPIGLLLLAQFPMTARLVGRTGQVRQLMFAPMSFLRAFWRGVGMTAATLEVLRKPRLRGGGG
jgi:cellulose synthase/poly-beta-1,6-N-acetylglucosamine synthase-like glycosyltransferase